MNKDRAYACTGCKGTVSIPKGRRNITLQQVQEHHNQTCPSRRGAAS